MRIQKFLPVILAIAAFVGSVTATEFRSPLIVERGPMRYVFEEWEESDYGLKIWTAGYCRESHKAFLSHGTNTHELSALFFNKSDFYLNEIFPNSYADINTEYYSPFLAVTKLSPRITYVEKGVSLGARFAYPVYKNKGRIGLRAQIPFKRIEIEREDPGDKDTNQLDDLLTKEVVTREGTTEVKDVVARAIRMDFLQSLLYTAKNRPILDFETGAPQFIGDPAVWNSASGSEEANSGVIIHSPEGIVPHKPERYLGINYQPNGTVTPNKAPTNLPANGAISDNKQYGFQNAVNYSALDMHTGTPAQMLQAQQQAAQLWVTSVHKQGGIGESLNASMNDKSKAMWNAIDAVLESYQGNAYEWLNDRGYVFESKTRCGVGDIDLDLFYEHVFNDDLIGEIMLGIRFPTGLNDNYCNNPYKPHLGNGEHWEIKLGGMIAWQPLDWMNIKFDARYVFVLEATEQRPAAFKGAQVKNIGPCTDADVDWGYFVGQLDFNLFHPKTDAISTLLGYEFYYKTKDDLNFKCKTMQSWLGRKWDSATSTWLENKQTLDNCVAEKNTEAIAHKFRFETSFRISRWFELFLGGAYTFAGQNIPRECDGHGGFVVTF